MDVNANVLPPETILFNTFTINLKYTPRSPTCIEFHKSGQFFKCLTAKSFFLIQMNENNRYDCIKVLNHKFCSTAMFSPSGNEVIFVSSKNYQILNIETDKYRYLNPTTTTNPLTLSKLAVSNEHSHIFASIENDNNLCLYDTNNLQNISKLSSNVKLNDITFSYDSQYIYGADKGEMYVWDIRSSVCYARYIDYGNINTLGMVNSPNGKYQATGSDFGVINLYQIENNFSKTTQPKPLKDFYNLTTPISSMAFSHDSQLLVVASDKKPLALRAINPKHLTVYKNFPRLHQNRSSLVTSMAFSPLSDSLIVGTTTGLLNNNLLFYKNK